MRRLAGRLEQDGLLRQVEAPPEWREKTLANCNTPADYAALFPETSQTT
jgi:hypothetical protein